MSPVHKWPEFKLLIEMRFTMKKRLLLTWFFFFLSFQIYLKASIQQQIGHSVGIFVQLSESPPFSGPLKDESSFVPMALHRFSKDLRNSVLLSDVALNVKLHAQQHIGSAVEQKQKYQFNALNTAQLSYSQLHLRCINLCFTSFSKIN